MNRLTNGKNRNRKRVHSRVNKNVQKIEAKNQSVRKKSNKKKYSSRKPSLGLKLRKNAAILMLIMCMLVLIFMNKNNISAFFTNIKTVTNHFSINAYYTVKFNANGGTGSIPDQTISYNVSTPLNGNTFNNNGFQFTGWNTEANGSGTGYSNTQEVLNIGDTTLYAQWEQIRGVKYAVQIYGINEDVDENGDPLGLTFGPAIGANYNNAYVTHEYEETTIGSGVYNVRIIKHTVDANGNETIATEYLKNSNGNNVTRTADEKNKYDKNIHNMTWEQIAAVSDKTDFLDCMLCGDTKPVGIDLNDTIGTGATYNQYGDGAGELSGSINSYYKIYNPPYNNTINATSHNNPAVGTGVSLDTNEQKWGSNARNSGGYSVSHFRATLIGENSKTNIGYAGDVNLSESNSLYSCLPSSLKSVITAKKIRYATGTSDTAYQLNDDISDKIWAFSERELFGTGHFSGVSAEGLGNDGHGYSKFASTDSKYYISSYNNDDAPQRGVVYDEIRNCYTWSLRSINLNDTYYTDSVYNTSGHFDTYRYPCMSYALTFGFCIDSVPVNYTIRFNANGGIGEMADQTMKSNEPTALHANEFTKEGYMFTGWNTKADGSGISYKNKEVVSKLSATDGEIINLYAQWRIKPLKYAVQIYGINEDKNEKGETLGLTFGPATGDNYNNKYVTHRYEETAVGSGVYNVIIVTHTVAADGTETTTEEILKNSSDNNVTRTSAEKDRYDKNIHSMTWSQIAAVQNKEDFLDCMLCGDTKAVEIVLNSELDKGNSYTQNGDGAGFLEDSIKSKYIWWNPTSEEEPTATNSDVQTGTNGADAGGYSSSHMRATLIGFNDKTDVTYAGSTNLTASNSLYSCINEELKSVITSKKVKYVTGNYKDGEYILNDDIADKIWLFSSREIGSIATYGGKGVEGLGDDGHSYGKFSNTDSHFYLEPNFSGKTTKRGCYREDDKNNYYWWLRTPYLISSYNVSDVGGSGSISYGWSGHGNGIAFGFCIDKAPINYTVKFDPNGGTGEMADQPMKSNTKVALRENTFTYEEKAFIGWNTKADGSGTSYADKEEVSNLASTEGAIVTLYAQWRRTGDPKKGDYVAYHPVASEIDSSYTDFQSGVLGYTASDHTYHVSNNYLGLSSIDSFEYNNEFTQEDLRWRIWDIDSEKVRLVPETSTQQKLGIKNTVGFNNGLFLMNDICSKLYAGEVDGITAKSLTFRDIEEKAILNYAATNSNSSGYVNNAGKPIWSEANIRSIFGLENTYGQMYILERTNSTTRRFIPTIFANETFNKTTTDTTAMISLSTIDLENDYANGPTYNPPTSTTYWQGPDSATPGTARPISLNQTYYNVEDNPTRYLDSIDRSLVFTGSNYWVASKSLKYTNSSTPYFQFYVRLVSNRDTLTQYVLSATNNQTGVTGSTIGTDGYGLRLRPIVTIDRSKFDIVDLGGDDWELASH